MHDITFIIYHLFFFLLFSLCHDVPCTMGKGVFLKGCATSAPIVLIVPHCGLQDCYWLADLAYISVPHMLPPFKGDQTTDQAEFTRVHQFYWVVLERVFADIHKFGLVITRYKGGTRARGLGDPWTS